MIPSEQISCKRGLLLGIDAGSSSTKLGLFTADGNLFRETSFCVRIKHPVRNQAELDLSQLMGDLIAYARNLVDGFQKEIRGIGFSVANPTVVFLDAQNQPTRPAIAYFDNRSAAEVTDFVERFGGENLYFGRVGNRPSPSTCVAATMQWVRSHEPEIWQATQHVCFLNGYLAAQFTGVLGAEATTASYSGLLRIKRPDTWEARFLELYDFPESILPPLVPCLQKLGGLTENMANTLSLPSGIPVSIGSADTAASSLAMGVRRHGDVFQSMGTSEVVVFCLNNPDFSPAFMNRSHVIPGLWLSNGAMSTAGGSIQWFWQHMASELKDVTELEALAKSSVRGANGVMYCPYLCGERSPMFDAKALGLFFGITIGTTKADLARAVYEGVSMAMNQIYRLGSKRWEVSPPYIACIGGATRSSLSLQLRASMQGMPMRTAGIPNAAAFGAALMGGFAGDVYGNIWDLPVVENYECIFEPDPYDTMFYLQYQEIYDSLYPSLKEGMHAFFDISYRLKSIAQQEEVTKK